MAKGKAVPLWLSVLHEVEKEPDVAEQLKDVSFSLVITFTDQDNESLSLTIDKGRQVSKEGEIPNPMAKVSFSSKVFEGLVTETVSPMKAIQKRMLTIDGDLSALLNLVYLLPSMKRNFLKITSAKGDTPSASVSPQEKRRSSQGK